MGFYDDVSCTHGLPDGRVVPNGRFQTKSLGRGSMEYAITAEGRLVQRLYRHETLEEQGPWGLPRYTRFPSGEEDTEFHGDVCLSGFDTQGQFVEYAARFTHGTLESLEPLSEVSEARRQMLAILQDRG